MPSPLSVTQAGGYVLHSTVKSPFKTGFFLVIVLIGSIGTGFFLKYKVLVLVATVVVI